MNGAEAGMHPRYISAKKIATKHQKLNLCIDENAPTVA
jgi:hypothetical protein